MEIMAALIAFVEDYLKSSCIPVHRACAVCEDCSWMDYGLRQALPKHQGYRFIQNYLKAVEGNTIYHLTDMFGCVYTMFRLPDSEELMVCGPVMFGNEGFPFNAAQSGLSLSEQSVLQDFYLRVTVFQHPAVYYNIFLTLSRHLYGADCGRVVNDSLSALEAWIELDSGPDQEEGPAARVQAAERWYDMEARLVKALCDGSESDVLEAVSSLQSMPLPHLLDDDIQDMRACMIALETLLRKSTEISGVPPSLFDSYCRKHIQLSGQITSRTEMNALLMEFIREHYLLIRRHSIKKYSLQTQKIITLIGQDITADLSLSAISEKLSSNAKYLSALFRREVGMTLTDYVNERRIKLAQRLLLFTDFPIKMIAHRCGIPDVHYFSHLFKKKVGCAPKAFRQNHVHV